jgi:hypothetical protein
LQPLQEQQQQQQADPLSKLMAKLAAQPCCARAGDASTAAAAAERQAVWRFTLQVQQCMLLTRIIRLHVAAVASGCCLNSVVASLSLEHIMATYKHNAALFT